MNFKKKKDKKNKLVYFYILICVFFIEVDLGIKI